MYMGKHTAKNEKTANELISLIIKISSDITAAVQLVDYAAKPGVSVEEHGIALSFWKKACDERRETLELIYKLFGREKESYARMLCPDPRLR